MIRNKTTEKLASLIAQGEKLVMSASCPDGLIGVPVVSRIDFDSWMGEVNTFNERQLKMHPQYNAIHTAFFHRRNHKRNCEEMVGLLRSVAQDTDFWQAQNSGFSQQSIPSSSKEVSDLQPTVFISHRSTDAKVADMLRDFLVGTGIPNDYIFCTSLPGNDVQYRISREVKEKIKYSAVNIALLSNDYYNSAYCINEAGIIWLREDATPIVIGMPEITHDNMLGFLNNDYKLRRLNSDDDIAAIYDAVQKAVGVPPATMSVMVNASHKLKEDYDALISSRKIEAWANKQPKADVLDLITTDDEKIVLFYILTNNVRRIKKEAVAQWLQDLEIYDVNIDNAFDLLSTIGSGENQGEQFELGIEYFRDITTKTDAITQSLSPILQKHITSSQTTLQQMFRSRQLDDGDMLFVAYIIDEKVVSFGARWQAETQIADIKAWEAKNSLDPTLSDNYGKALGLFIQNRLVYESAWTSNGNAKEFSLCSSARQWLLQNPSELEELLAAVKIAHTYELPF